MNKKVLTDTEIDLEELIQITEKQKGNLGLAIGVITGNVDLKVDINISRNMGIVVTEMFLLVIHMMSDLIYLGRRGGLSIPSCIPISRTVIETCINISYILACGEPKAEKAMNHAIAKTIQGYERESGNGAHAMRVRKLVPEEFKQQFENVVKEFTSKKGRSLNWTQHSVSQRIDKINEVFGDVIARNLNAGYVGGYSDSSETIHGSFVGCLLAHGREPFTEIKIKHEDYKAIYDKQLEGLLAVTYMSMSSAMRSLQKNLELSGDPFLTEENFDRFTELMLGDDMPKKDSI